MQKCKMLPHKRNFSPCFQTYNVDRRILAPVLEENLYCKTGRVDCITD